MKNLLLLLTFLAGTLVAGAQKVYFIYVQSEGGAPFYVRLGEKVYSSTTAGYVIVSNLKDSTYLLQVGFAGQNTESRFPVSLNKEDKGFVLKQVGGAWNLFDLQQLTLIKALAASGPTEAENQQLLASADPFLRMLVEASDDMTLLQAGPSEPTMQTLAQSAPVEPAADTNVTEPAPVAIMPAPIRPATVEATPVQAVLASEVNAVAQPAVIKDTIPAATEALLNRSVVTRRSESSTTEGFGLVFLDKQGEVTDTIRLLIPNPKMEVARAAVPDPASVPAAPVAEVKADTVTIVKKDEAPVVADSSAGKKVVPAAAAAVTDCKVQAEDKDFLKLRKNMAAADDESAMLGIARRNFNDRCYTTEQVRYLSALFLTALGKYNFFEAAREHVSDPGQFSGLSSELKDPYFNQRFQDLIK